MMGVMEDRDLWRLNLELLPLQLSRKNVNEERKSVTIILLGLFYQSYCNLCNTRAVSLPEFCLFSVFAFAL